MKRALSPLIAVVSLLSLAPAASASEPQRLAWDELHQLVGRQVSIPLYDGCAVSGKVLEIQSGALLLDVSKTSHPHACPTGPLRVPRATLYVLDVHKQGIRQKVVGTASGVLSVGRSGPGSTADRNAMTIHIVH